MVKHRQIQKNEGGGVSLYRGKEEFGGSVLNKSSWEENEEFEVAVALTGYR